MFNSSLIKSVYPMVDEIKIKDIQIDGDKRDNYMNIDIIVDCPDMDYVNMYCKKFDPHWLVDNHIEKLLPFVSLKVPHISFTVHNKDGKLIYFYESRHKKDERPKFFDDRPRQNEAIGKLNKFFLKG